MLNPELTRGARALLNWSQSNLAKHSNLTLSTIRDFESGARNVLKNNLMAIQIALENDGIVFDTTQNGTPSIQRVEKGANHAVVADPDWPAGVRRVAL